MSEQNEQPEGNAYRVHLIHSVSTVVDVEPTDGITSVDGAIDFALSNAPDPTNSSNHGIDPDGEWTENAVYGADGVTEIWSASSPAAQAPERQEFLIFTAIGPNGTLTLDLRDGDDKSIAEVTLDERQAWRLVRGTSPAKGEGKLHR